MHKPSSRDDEGIVPYKFYEGSRNNWGIVTGGNPRRGPHQSALYYGITATGSDYDFDSLRGAPLVRNDMRCSGLVRNDIVFSGVFFFVKILQKIAENFSHFALATIGRILYNQES